MRRKRREKHSILHLKDPPQPQEDKDRPEDCQDNLEHLMPQATTASSVTKAKVEKRETDSSHQNKWAHSKMVTCGRLRNQLKPPK